MNENQIAIIFIGRSGSGKGTQAQLIKNYLDGHSIPNIYIGTGNSFREMMLQDDFTAKKAKQIYDEGGRHPDFLLVTVLGNIFRFQYKQNQSVIIDGGARSLHEAENILEMLKFYELKRIKILHLNVSFEWSVNKLRKRGRDDDNEEIFAIKKEWYEKDVLPAIEFFRNNPAIEFCEIDGEREIDEVHQEIKTCLG